jgi:serine/threonine protein kinase
MKTQRKLHGYRLGEIIHTGNMSQVWKAKGPKGQQVVLKVPLNNSKQGRSLAAELRAEARVLKRLDHDNVVKLVSFHNDRRSPALALEYFPGRNLAVLCKDDRNLVKNHLPWVLIQLCRALKYVHGEGYVHRDVKPGNVLMSKAGEMMLIDFSLSRKLRGWFGTGLRDRAIAGTRSYVAPEQLVRKRYDQRADIYSLGVMMYKLLTDKLPFTGTSSRELAEKHRTVPPTPLTAHDKSVTREAKNPKDRPASVAEVLHKVRSMELFK